MGRAFFDVRIFDPNAQHHEKKTLKRCYKTDEKEKKRNHNSRVFNVEQGSFTPLVFPITGGMRRKSWMLVKCQLTATKRKK